MPKIRAGEEITIPISEEFANLLFEGRNETAEFRTDGERIRTLVFSSEDYIPLLNPAGRSVFYTAIDMFVRNLSSKLQRLYAHEHSIKKYFAAEYWLDLNEPNGVIYLIGFPRGLGRVSSSRLAILYGEWDDAGPRLKLKWLQNNPRIGVIEGVELLIKILKEYDAFVSDEANIGSRMRSAKRSIEAFNTAKKELKNLPEDVVEYVIGPMMRNKTNKAAPLSRLVKNKHGGARRKATRRKH
jgi:hypothetical protein